MQILFLSKVRRLSFLNKKRKKNIKLGVAVSCTSNFQHVFAFCVRLYPLLMSEACPDL